MYATGLRVSELVKLKAQDINLDVGFIRCTGKGSKERIVPLGGVASRFLQKYLQEARGKLLGDKIIDYISCSRWPRYKSSKCLEDDKGDGQEM